MQDLSSSLIILLPSLFGGFLGGTLLFFVRDVWLVSKRTSEQHRRELVQNKLEKLYTPLFMRVKYQEFIIRDESNKPNLTFVHEEDEKDFASTVLNYGYLADDELMPLLPRVIGVGFFDDRNKEIAQHFSRLVISEYEKLRKEYFG